MPKIFSNTDRTNIRMSLLLIGRKMLEKSSYKNISVADIALDAGIAKGTFYNFFPSKEVFFYEIMLQIRDENRLVFTKLMENPTTENTYRLFYERYTSIKTVYDYFTTEELKIIFRRLPHQQKESDENSLDLAKKLIAACTNRKDVKAEVIVNLMNIAASSSAHREFLLPENYNETIAVLAKAITDYIFEG